MSEYLTIQEIAADMGLSPATISNYTSGARSPLLPVDYRKIVRGGMAQAQIRREDYEIWKAQYLAKPAFGSKLHKSRVENLSKEKGG